MISCVHRECARRISCDVVSNTAGSSCQLHLTSSWQLKLKILSVRTCIAPWHFTRTYVFRVQYLDRNMYVRVKRFNFWMTEIRWTQRDSQLTNPLYCLTESFIALFSLQNFPDCKNYWASADESCILCCCQDLQIKFSNFIEDETFKSFLAITESSRLLRFEDNKNHCVSGWLASTRRWISYQWQIFT